MRKAAVFVLAGTLIASGAAFGKLPPPTPEEEAATAAKKAAEEAELEKQKTLLDRAQDRVVARYRGDHPAAGAPGATTTEDHNMPKTTSERPRGTGPDPVRPQSAEAHSAPAK